MDRWEAVSFRCDWALALHVHYLCFFLSLLLMLRLNPVSFREMNMRKREIYDSKECLLKRKSTHDWCRWAKVISSSRRRLLGLFLGEKGFVKIRGCLMMAHTVEYSANIFLQSYDQPPNHFNQGWV